MKPTTIFLLLTLCTQVLFGQENCMIFEDYTTSQDWIKTLQEETPKNRKANILKRIVCEQNSEYNFRNSLTVIIDGTVISQANAIPTKQNELLEMIIADNFSIESSSCEVENIYGRKCNLGHVIISGGQQPIFNENEKIDIIDISRKKSKTIIKLKSTDQVEAALHVTDFLGKQTFVVNRTLKIKKGKNRIIVTTDSDLNVITIEENGLKTIILK